MLYATVSEIFLRDLNAYLQLNFVRLWDNPDDLFNVVDPTPIIEFRNYWQTQMPWWSSGRGARPS